MKKNLIKIRINYTKHCLLGLACALFSFTQAIGQESLPSSVSEYIYSHSFQKKSLQQEKVHSISCTYFYKKPLKPIYQYHGKSQYWEIDDSGRITKNYYTIPLPTGNIDTVCQWLSYSEGQLSQIKKTGIGGVRTKSIVYENDMASFFIYSVSHSASNSKIVLNLSSYQEIEREYLNYVFLNEKDTLINHKSEDGILFKATLIEYVGNKKTTTIHFPFDPYKNFTKEETISQGKTESITIENEIYEFQYNAADEIVAYTKLRLEDREPTHFSEFVFGEDNGLLKAIITKNLEDSSIEIKKYAYHYDE